MSRTAVDSLSALPHSTILLSHTSCIVQPVLCARYTHLARCNNSTRLSNAISIAPQSIHRIVPPGLPRSLRHIRPIHASTPRLHGRHHHEHEDDDDDDHDHDHAHHGRGAPTRPLDKQRMQHECTQITLYGLYSNIGLSIFKLISGIVGNSMAMIADAVHSLSDLVTDGITLWSSRLTHKPPDADHPFGHGKFEAIGSMTIAATLVATAGGIGWSAIGTIQSISAGEILPIPTGIALVAAVVSIAVKELLYHATMRVGNRWNSKVVKANAWHHRSDSISTCVALIGVVGAMIKLPILDPLAGLFVSGLILKAALELGWDSLRDLTDENVDERLQQSVATILTQMKREGVVSFHRLRGRAMGPFILMDCHISVDPSLSVSAAHQIAERARMRVRRSLPVIAEFMVHVDVAQEESFPSVFSCAEDDVESGVAMGEGESDGVEVVTERHAEEIVREYEMAQTLSARIAEQSAHAAGTVPIDAASGTTGATLPEPSSQGASAASEWQATTGAPRPTQPQLSNDGVVEQKEEAASGMATAKSKIASTFQNMIKQASGDPLAAETAAISAAAGSSQSTVAASPSSSSSSSTPSTSDSTAPSRDLDLSTLMRPQASIERDVRRVLSDPSRLYARELQGIAHFTAHWVRQKLTIQLELTFRSDLTISSAKAIARAIEADILREIKDVNQVDCHLELTEEHVRKAHPVEPTLQLPPSNNQTGTNTTDTSATPAAPSTSNRNA